MLLFSFYLLFPDNLLDAGEMVEVSGGDEEIVGETIDVDDDSGVYIFGISQVEESSFGASTHGARHMGRSG